MLIPEEIILEILSHLTLLGIIHARSVCKRWRQIVLLADIPLPRVQLYYLYLDCVSSDTFQESRSWTLDKLFTFDRKAYIENLERQYPHIPDDFVFWVLEWPAKAVVGGLWPGLPCERESSVSGMEKRTIPGANELGRPSPTIDTIASYELASGKNGSIRGLRMMNVDGYQTWMVLDAPRKENRGSVIEYLESVMTINDGYVKDAYETSSWMEWQRLQLED